MASLKATQQGKRGDIICRMDFKAREVEVVVYWFVSSNAKGNSKFWRIYVKYGKEQRVRQEEQ